MEFFQTIKNRVVADGAMHYLDKSPEDLPGFNVYEWKLLVAVIIAGRDATTHDAKHCMLVVQQQPAIPTPHAIWGLLAGIVVSSDTNIRAAVARLVQEHCGLHLKYVLDSIKGVHFSPPASGFPGRVTLRFVVSVEEEDLLHTGAKVDDIPIALSGYPRHSWLSSEQDLVRCRARDLVMNAFHWPGWLYTSDCLHKRFADLPYREQYSWHISGVVVHEPAELTPEIMLLQQAEGQGGEWELPGYREGMYTDTRDIEQFLRQTYEGVTGLRVLSVEPLGSIEKALVKRNPSNPGNKGKVILVYRVRVEPGDVRLQSSYSEWRWVGANELGPLRMERHMKSVVEKILEASNTGNVR